MTIKEIYLSIITINIKYLMEQQIKPQRYQFFLDVSGSVSRSENYWTTVNDVFSMYANQVQNFYFWDHNIEIVNKKQVQDAIQSRMGRGGNQTWKIAQECVKKNYKYIILLTDGEVEDRDVRKCDQILEKYTFQKSICYIITSYNYGRQPNMSVTCPFTRKCENKVFRKTHNGPLETVVQFTPQDYKILDTLDTITLQNFEAEYEKIQGLIIALNMGKSGNIPLKNDLVILKNRLVKELAKQKGDQKKQLSLIVRQYLQKNDFNSAIQQMKTVCNSYFSDSMTTDLEKKISHLINLCGDLTGKYNLNEIKSNKMATAKTAEQGKINLQVQITDLSKNLIECPILNDDDVPQILIDQCQPLLLGIQKSIVDDIAACPLRILNYPDIKAKLKSRLSNFVGVMGIKAHFDKNLLKNPFTQNRLLGGIPLGTDKSHVKVGNHTIAKLISGGKILGNLNLYYAVIWYLINQGSIQYLKDIQKNATQHLVYRLKNSKTYASMCGQAQFVTTEVSTDVAIWFCVNSGYLNQPTDRDTFRFHLSNIEPMIKIVQVLGYPNDKGLMAHYNRTKTLIYLLSIFKNMKSKHDKVSFKNMLLGLYQNGVFVNVKNLHQKFIETQSCSVFVPTDGEASPQQIEKVRTIFSEQYKFTKLLTNEELFYFGLLVDPQKQASGYFIDYNIQITALPKFQVNWKYGLQKTSSQIKICPKTLRPIYQFKDHTWRQQAKQTFKMEASDLFNGYKYYEAYILKYNQAPNVDQLILFYYNRYIEAGKYKTLPYLTLKWTQQIVQNYRPLVQKMKIEDIIKALNESRKIQTRIKLESEG